jgi:intracellular septation protein A
MWFLLFISLAPLFVFAFINYRYHNLKKSVLSGIISALLLLVVLWAIFDWVDYELVSMLVFMVILGAIAIRKNEEFYFKLQPAITGFIAAILILYYEIFRGGLLPLFASKFQKVMSEDQIRMLQNPQALDLFVKLSYSSVFWIIRHSALLAWAAKYSSIKIWLLIKTFFIPLFVVVNILTLVLLQLQM